VSKSIPKSVKIISGVCRIIGVLSILEGAFFCILFGLAWPSVITFFVGTLVIVLGVFLIICGSALGRGKNWARKATITLIAILVLIAILGMFHKKITIFDIVVIIIGIVIIYYLAFDQKIKQYFL